MTAFSPVAESKIRDTQSRIAKREEAAKQAERQAETRQTISPNDLIARERHKAVCDHYIASYERECEQKRQAKIKEANPRLIALKAEYMTSESANRRAACAQEFADLYRRSYGKDVPVEVIDNEWRGERRKLFLTRVYAGAR